MPAIVNTLRVESDVIAASLTIDLPTGYVVDDYLFAFVAQDGGATNITTATSGWVAVGTTAASGGNRSRWFYKKCDSTSETAPTFSGSNDDWGYVVHVIRGVNTSNPVNVVDRTDWNNIHEVSTGTPTTTVDNCLCLIGMSGDSNSQYFQDETVFPLAAGNSSGACGFFTGYFNQYTAGTVTARKMYVDQADEGGNIWIIAIENATNGPMMPDAGTAVRVIDYHQINTGRTFNAPNSEFTTIDSQSMDGAATISFLAVIADPGRWSSYTTFNSASNTSDWAGGVHVLPSATDMTNAVYSIIWRISSTAQMGAKGVIVAFKDNAGAWVAYTLSRKPGLTILPQYYTNHIALGQATPLDSSGTIDWSNITKIGYFFQRGLSATGMSLNIFNASYTKRDGYVTGGSSIAPANTATPALLALGTYRSGFNKAGLQGNRQWLMTNHVQFGDGSTPTYVDLDGCSIETPEAYNYAAGRRWWNVSDDFLTITVKACATCTMLFRNCVVAPSVRSTFQIDSGSSTAGTWSFEGSSWSNCWFISKTGVTVNKAIFTNCPEIDAKGGTFTNCTISNSQTASAAMTATAGATIQNCAFTAKNASDYALRLTNAGTYTLDGTTFSGFTTAINITAVSGTVTLHLALGQTQPTYTTAGATVVFDQAVLDTSFTNADLANGTTILVYNVTQSIAIEYIASLSTGTGYTISMVPGVDYTVGDVIEIRMAQKDGDVYYVEKTYRIVTSAGGGDFVDEDALALCSVCNSFNLDGSDYASLFDIDEANDELDILIAGPWAAGELITWWKWQMTQQSAMEDYWLAWDVQSDGSFMNDTTKISSYLDNTTASSAIESSGRRIWRSDGARPIRDPTSGGGALDVAWREPVTIVETGTSGLTPTEAATLDVLNSFTFTVPGQVDANIQYVNDTQVIGIGTTDNPWNPIGGD